LTPDAFSEISQVSSHSIGNIITVEIVPSSEMLKGEKITSEEITIVNTIPIITNATISPSQPSSNSNLVLTYLLDDTDIVKSDQTDQSSIIWEKSIDGTTFSEVTSLSGLSTIPASEISSGDFFRAKITPYDGFDLGAVATSNVVNIS